MYNFVFPCISTRVYDAGAPHQIFVFSCGEVMKFESTMFILIIDAKFCELLTTT